MEIFRYNIKGIFTFDIDILEIQAWVTLTITFSLLSVGSCFEQQGHYFIFCFPF